MPSDSTVAPPMVTVVITTYNHAPFIAECLDGVLMQRTHHPVDIVVLDDCSTDGTQAILLDYQQRHPERLQLALSEVNRANCAAFAAAVLAATTPYVAVLDGDDFWTHPDKLQRQIDYLDAHPGCALCFHNVTEVFDDGSQPPILSNPPDQKRVSQLDDLLQSCFVSTCSTLYRRSAVPAFPDWYTDDPSADWSMAIIAACHGTIDYIDEAMAVYRRHARGVWTGASWEQREARIVAFYERMCAFLPTRHQPLARTLLAGRAHALAQEYADRGDAVHAGPYFDLAFAAEPDRRRLAWDLRTANGNAARLVFPGSSNDGVRVEIDRVIGATAYDIQLNHARLSIEASRRYVVRFRARADRRRTVAAGVAQAHEPWQGLGYYRVLQLSPEWLAVEDEFVAGGTTTNARVHFDLGGDAAGVEIAAMALEPAGR